MADNGDSEGGLLYTRFMDFAELPKEPRVYWWVCEQYINSGLSQNEYACNHSISPGTLSKWLKIYRESLAEKMASPGMFIGKTANGRRPLLDRLSLEAIRETLTQSNVNFKRTSMPKAFLEEAERTMARKGLKTAIVFSKSSRQRYSESLSIQATKGQAKTKARLRAEADPRNFITMAAMMSVFSPLTAPELLSNFDATQYSLCDDSNDVVVVIKGESSGQKQFESVGTTGIAIKHYHYHNASGMVAPPVFLAADETMADHEFEVHEVLDLTTSQSPGQKGYLCFAKTRNANQGFYRWLLKDVVLPFVTICRGVGEDEYKYDDGSQMRAMVYCDGEEVQIRELQTPEMIALLADNLVDFGKTPASCSGKCQSSDVSYFFKGVKKFLQLIDTHEWESPRLRDRLKALVKDRKMTDSHKVKTVEGLQKIIYALKSVISRHVVADGYRMCGQHPFSFEKVLTTCTRPYSVREWTVILEKRGDLEALMESNGRITEKEMDDLGIVNENYHDTHNGVVRDERPLQNQRACIMTSEATRANYKDYHRKRLAAAAAKVARALVPAQVRRSIVVAEKIRKAAVKATDVAKRAAERGAYTLMSKEEKREWNKENRKAKKRRKEIETADLVDEDAGDLLEWADNQGDDLLDGSGDFPDAMGYHEI